MVLNLTVIQINSIRMKICRNFTKKIGIKNFTDMDNINYLLTEKNKFIYLNKKKLHRNI